MGRVEWTEDESRRFAADARKMASRYTVPWATIIAQALPSQLEQPRIVDLGCGPGLLACELGDQVPSARLTLVDRSETMLTLAAEELRRRGQQATRLQCRAESVDLPDRQADVVICKHLLLHADDRSAVMAESFRILAHGGLALLIDFDPAAPRWRAAAIWAGARAWLGRYRASRFWWGFTHGIPLATVNEELRAAGFHDLSSQPRGVMYVVMARKPENRQQP